MRVWVAAREDCTMSGENNCSTMALWCAQRAKADPKNSQKWLGQAERWRDLARVEGAWRLQKTGSAQQTMHPGPMAMQPNASNMPSQQQG
jgi:hypothetical protein